MSFVRATALCALALAAVPALADENLFGYVRGAEPLPKGASELYQYLTLRTNKGAGHYRALDTATEYEHGVTDRLSASAELLGQSINVQGLRVDGYIPADKRYGWRPSGLELSAKYNFLSAAKDDIGLSARFGFSQRFLDPHSGQVKRQSSLEGDLLVQKYFLEGQVTWVGNLGFEATYAKRKPVNTTVEWSTSPETEIEWKTGTGVAYRFAPKWSIGAEALFETEYETEVGQERWSVFGGPTLHYGGEKWWATLTWFRQLRGGGERFDEQRWQHLHLIEKTRDEVRVKVGYNF